MIYFTEYLRSNLYLTPEQQALLLEGSISRELEAEEYLLRRGESCRHRFFVEQGSLREYSIDERGREHLLHFATEGWFLVSVDTIYFDRPSSYFLQCIEPSRVLMIQEEQYQRLVCVDEAFARLDRQLLFEHIQALHQRITALQSTSARERYESFVRTYPEVMMRAPQSMIASWLGIAPESLSRIRRELAGR